MIVFIIQSLHYKMYTLTTHSYIIFFILLQTAWRLRNTSALTPKWTDEWRAYVQHISTYIHFEQHAGLL